MNVLIAEDDQISARALQLIVEKLGHDVIVTGNGRDAWEHFTKSRVNVLLTDWQMPEMDGLELCRKIRSLRKADYPYIIMLTAKYATREHCREAMSAGVDDFLLKPFDREQLTVRLAVAERIINSYAEIYQLKQLVPICGYCKSIRDDANYWQSIETYLHSSVGRDLTHSICPKCFERLKAELPPNIAKELE